MSLIMKKESLKTTLLMLVFLMLLGNTAMTCLLTMQISRDRKILDSLQSNISELQKTLETEVEIRRDLFSKLKKSAKLLKKYNPALNDFTALRYAYKIFECSDNNVSINILTSLIVVESSANFRAVSHKGALGLTQVMPNIWKCDKKMLADPYKNIEVGSSILKHYINRHGLMGGLSAYNSGKKNRSIKYAKKVVRIANKYF